MEMKVGAHGLRRGGSWPEDNRVVFRDVWSYQAVADALYACSGQRVSRSTVRRVLAAGGWRPHRVRYWLHSPDPDFRAKVARICRLYRHPPQDAVVVCIDEKPMQALARRHPIHVGRRGIVRHESSTVGAGHARCSRPSTFARVRSSVASFGTVTRVHCWPSCTPSPCATKGAVSTSSGT